MRNWTPMPRHLHLYSYETQDGTRYAIRRGYANSEGQRTEYTRSGFVRWRDAEAALKKFESDLALAHYDVINSGRITLQAAWEHLLEIRKKDGTWRPSTTDQQISLYHFYLEKPLGSMTLKSIRRPQVRDWLRSMEKKGLAHDSIRSAYTTLNTILNAAVRDDLLDKNRVTGLDYAGLVAKPKIVPPEQFSHWMATAKNILTEYDWLMLQILADTGMRRGELLGLHAEAVTFKRDELHGKDFATIRVNQQRTRDSPNGGPLKTQASYRTLAVSGRTATALRKAIAISDLRRVVPDSPKWIWLDRNGNPCSLQHLRYLCNRVSDVAGVHIHPHMFRHYFATQAIASGVPEIDVMHFLGHSSVQMTADYTRDTEHSNLEVANAFQRMVSFAQ